MKKIPNVPDFEENKEQHGTQETKGQTFQNRPIAKMEEEEENKRKKHGFRSRMKVCACDDNVR